MIHRLPDLWRSHETAQAALTDMQSAIDALDPGTTDPAYLAKLRNQLAMAKGLYHEANKIRRDVEVLAG